MVVRKAATNKAPCMVVRTLDSCRRIPPFA